jgi:D-proline reductase (dithiol) PrdB
MTEQRTLLERLSNRFFAIPAVAQWWAKRAASRTEALVDLSGPIPFARLRKPLSECRLALITTGGTHLRGQTPFDMENPQGDATYREIPNSVALEQIMITHKYYDHSDADADLNVVLPLAHFRDLVNQRVIGELAPRHFGFMGHIDADQIPILNQRTAPEVAGKLRADGVDCVFLTPA